jgi:hypothetical protein
MRHPINCWKGRVSVALVETASLSFFFFRSSFLRNNGLLWRAEAVENQQCTMKRNGNNHKVQRKLSPREEAREQKQVIEHLRKDLSERDAHVGLLEKVAQLKSAEVESLEAVQKRMKLMLEKVLKNQTKLLVSSAASSSSSSPAPNLAGGIDPSGGGDTLGPALAGEMRGDCCVCLAAPALAAFSCGHLCACLDCAHHMERYKNSACPLCSVCGRWMRIYFT